MKNEQMSRIIRDIQVLEDYHKFAFGVASLLVFNVNHWGFLPSQQMGMVFTRRSKALHLRALFVYVHREYPSISSLLLKYQKLI
jgi:hypothetical protein